MSCANEYRYELGKYYRQNVAEFGKEQANRMRHPRVHYDDEWAKLLCKLKFAEFKKLSIQNSQSRPTVPYFHKGCSKSNANLHYEMRKEKPETTWVDVWEKQHSYDLDTSVSEQAKQHHKKNEGLHETSTSH